MVKGGGHKVSEDRPSRTFQSRGFLRIEFISWRQKERIINDKHDDDEEHGETKGETELKDEETKLKG